MEPHMNRATKQAWDLVQFGWDTAYVFSYDPSQELPFRADRRDGQGSVSAEEPDELDDLVLQDYTARPVPREVAP
jgi:hypothetical protein